MCLERETASSERCAKTAMRIVRFQLVKQRRINLKSEAKGIKPFSEVKNLANSSHARGKKQLVQTHHHKQLCKGDDSNSYHGKENCQKPRKQLNQTQQRSFPSAQQSAKLATKSVHQNMSNARAQ